jgi:hypothetical protein
VNFAFVRVTSLRESLVGFLDLKFLSGPLDLRNFKSAALVSGAPL